MSSLQGCLSFLITGRGEFRAWLTQVALNAMRISAAEERLSRIAFVAVPADAVMIMFPIGKVAPACAGLKMQMPPRAAAREYPITAPTQRDSIDLDQRKGSVAVRRRLAGQCKIPATRSARLLPPRRTAR